jgi:hypothetical protein
LPNIILNNDVEIHIYGACFVGQKEVGRERGGPKTAISVIVSKIMEKNASFFFYKIIRYGKFGFGSENFSRSIQ